MPRPAVLVPLMFAAAVAAQSATDASLVRAQPLDETELAPAGVVFDRKLDGTRMSQVLWRGNVLPVQAPRERVAVGLLGPDRLVVLAAGVRESLVVYVVDEAGAIARLETQGGRRLPSTFRPMGTWPVAVGRNIFVIAYERDGLVELRGFGFGEKMFAAATLPAGATGFHVEYDETYHRIQVMSRPGLLPVAEFTHPDAPRIEFKDTKLEFGTVPTDGSRTLAARLGNPTAEPILVEVRAEGAFAIDEHEVLVQPRSTAELAVRFRPGASMEHRGTLRAWHSASERPLELPLLGTGVRPPVLATEAVLDGTNAGDREPALAGVAPPAAPSTPAAPSGAPEARQPLARQHATPPELVQHEDALVLRGLPGEVLVLAVVDVLETPAGLLPALPRSSWRVRLSTNDGSQTVPFGSLGLREGQAVVALRRTDLGVVGSPPLVPDPLRAPDGLGAPHVGAPGSIR